MKDIFLIQTMFLMQFCSNKSIQQMKLGKSFFFVIIGLILLINPSFTLLTRRMVKNKFQRSNDDPLIKSGDSAPVVETSCNVLDFSKTYNYSGIVASGYLRVNKNNSALAYTFYGKKGVTSRSQLRNYPTILWLNGGPGSSSQIGNLQQIGPLTLTREFSVVVKQNNYTWANNYNLLFIDQPVGTGLSYADTTSSNTFAKSMDEVAHDFYFALRELYLEKGCFSPTHFSIPPSSPLFIFGQSYGGKYAPAIALQILKRKQDGGFLTGLKGLGIGDGFTFPYEILSEVGTYSYHLGLIDFQERMKLEKVLLNASRHAIENNYDAMHLDFDNALDYIVEKAGNVNVYDIKIDGDYEELLQPYFRDTSILKDIYGFNPEIGYDQQSDLVYDNLFTDFMKPEITRVEEILYRGLPVLIYNGQDDLIVQNPGTMKWVDRIYFKQADAFRKALFTPWKINNKVVGAMKRAGLLEFRIVNKAGHLVPMDRPVEALDMVVSFVQRAMSV